MKKNTRAGALALALVVAATISCNKESGPVREAVSNKNVYQEAYIYGFPIPSIAT
jgi:hypothetical protein